VSAADEIRESLAECELSAGNLATSPSVEVLYELVQIVQTLAEQVASLERMLNSRTEHLA